MGIRYAIDLNLLQEIADAIRLKTGDASLIVVKDFPEKILGITTGIADITSEIDELGNVTSYGLISTYNNNNVSIYGFNSFSYENENVIIS